MAQAHDRKQIIIWSLVFLGIIGLFVGLVYLGGRGNQPQQVTITIDPLDNIKGMQTAPVTLVEYSDFECPACRMYEPLVSEVAQAFPNDLRIVYRHFPLTSIHTKALIAAEASEAASLQGKFWEMHDLLFNNQEEWVKSSETAKLLTQYAQSLGLNTTQFEKDIASTQSQERVQKDISSGNELNINATPTFYLNGKQIRPTSLDEFKSFVQKALDDTK